MCVTAQGFRKVNAYEIGQGDVSIRALYLQSSMLAHSCIPNTSHIDYGNFKMIIRSSVRISRNHMITMSYTNTLDATFIRRDNLKKSKFFDCKCPRCSDRTELGTFVSALKCPICKTGKIMPTDPLSNSIWNCSNTCPFQISSTDVNNLVQKLRAEFKSIDSDNIMAYERFLSKHSHVLHENHSINLEINYILSQLYGKISNYIINEMPNNLLERKRNLCVDLLKIFDVIDPGQSRLRGVTLYELHAPLMILAQRRYEAKQISKNDLAKEFAKIKAILHEVVIILKNEPDNSAEKQLSLMANNGLSQMKTWNKFLKSK